jgi:putative methionine-R-sulfoxide reductase with GAF domain
MVSNDPLLRLQASMDALGRIDAACDSVDALLQRIVNEVMSLCDATGAVVELADGNELVYVAAAGSVAKYVGLRLNVATSLSGVCVRTGEIQRCGDTESDARVNREACRMIRARSMLIVPLPHKGRTVGVLKALSQRIFAFSPADEQLLRSCAGVIGTALGRQLDREAHQAHRTRTQGAHSG